MTNLFPLPNWAQVSQLVPNPLLAGSYAMAGLTRLPAPKRRAAPRLIARAARKGEVWRTWRASQLTPAVFPLR